MFKMLKIINLSARFQKRLFSSGLPKLAVSQDHLKFVQESVKRLRFYDKVDLLPADLDWSYLLDTKNIETLNENVKSRKGNGDIFALVN